MFATTLIVYPQSSVESQKKLKRQKTRHERIAPKPKRALAEHGKEQKGKEQKDS